MAAVLGLTPRGRAVPSGLNGVTGAGKGSVILGVALPLNHLVPLIVSFHLLDDVSCSEAGEGCEILSLIYSVTGRGKTHIKLLFICGNIRKFFIDCFHFTIWPQVFLHLVLFILFDPSPLFCPTPA